MSFEQVDKVISPDRELSSEEIQQLTDFWFSEVVSEKKYARDPLNSEELRDQFFASLMDDVGVLNREWGLIPDKKLLQGIKIETDPARKAELEFKYLESIQKMVGELKKKFKASADNHRTNKWDTYTAVMRKEKDFNCVGATLIGMDLIKQANLEQYYGNPVGHAVNVIKISNGEWAYLDLANDQLLKIAPEEEEIDGVKIFKLDQSKILYSIIRVRDQSYAPSSILGNFSAMIEEAQEPLGNKQDQDKKKTIIAFQKIQDRLQGIDFERVRDALYPDHRIAKEMMEQDGDIINLLRRVSDVVNRQFKNRADTVKFLEYVRLNKDKVFRFMSGESNSDISLEGADRLDDARRELARIKSDSPHIYKEVLRRLEKVINGL